MNAPESSLRDYQRIETALNYVADNFREQPTLAEIASVVHLSEHHFQRLFQRWAGVSPKQFLQYTTVQHARQCLATGMSAAQTSYEVGLNAPARLGELFIRLEALTPGEYKNGGAGLSIDYGSHASPFGECLIANTERGVCGLRFLSQGEAPEQVLKEIKGRLPKADYHHAPNTTAPLVQQIFSANTQESLSLLVAGTPFQLKVWEALLHIPAGELISYQQLAGSINKPSAMRAVGTAVGQNPVALLIPCHRVIRGDGTLGGYRWGIGRKLALLGSEAAHSPANVAGP